MNEPLPKNVYGNAGRRRQGRRLRVAKHIEGLREEIKQAHPEDRDGFVDLVRELHEDVTREDS